MRLRISRYQEPERLSGNLAGRTGLETRPTDSSCSSDARLLHHAFTEDLPGDLVRIADGEGAGFDLLFGVIAARFAEREARQGDRQRHQRQEFFLILLNVSRIGHDGRSVCNCVTV